MGLARPWRRILVVLAIAVAGVLQAPREAAACESLGPYLGTATELPLGCPLVVYAGTTPEPDKLRQITALRGGAYVDVTGAVTQGLTQLLVERTFVDCQLQVLRVDQTRESFLRLEIYPQGVSVGERIGLGIGWFGGIEIVPAGACAAPIEPRPACTSVPPCGGFPLPPFDDESAGCAAGGGAAGGGAAGGAALGALGLLLRGRARRRGLR
jgi:hypothetical protein